MFTIGNAIKLLFNSNPDSFFVFLVLGFWNENLLNVKLSLGCCKYFLETILFIFIKILMEPKHMKICRPKNYIQPNTIKIRFLPRVQEEQENFPEFYQDLC